MVEAVFRFYEELNDFLPPARRGVAFAVPCAERATVKHMIEALGVPHTEVELILVDGQTVGFDHLLADGERVAVYPVFEAMDVQPLLRVRAEPLRVTRFIADAHLGGLARLLRMAGFDTVFRNDYADAEVVDIALREQRIILSRDRELLKRREVTHGCFVHAQAPPEQWLEVVRRLDLARRVQPFSRCLVCNAPLHEIDRAAVLERLPPCVRARDDRLMACEPCDRIYWPGSHWVRMRRQLDGLLGELLSGPSGTSP